MAEYVLRLYITGHSVRSAAALANLRRLCREDLQGEVELEVIDLAERPELAEDEKILATPALIRHIPPPLRRVIGDLSNREKVLLGLDLVHPSQGADAVGATAGDSSSDD